jgi:hypothetical protein
LKSNVVTVHSNEILGLGKIFKCENISQVPKIWTLKKAMSKLEYFQVPKFGLGNKEKF